MTLHADCSIETPMTARSGRFGTAILASFLFHAALVAAAVYLTREDEVTLPPTAIAVEIIAMSPNPGGKSNAGLPTQGSAPPVSALQTDAGPAPAEPAASSPLAPLAPPRPVESAEPSPSAPDAITLDEPISPGRETTFVTFQLPPDRPIPPQPRTPPPPSPTAEAPAPVKPSAVSKSVDTPPPQAPRASTRDFALASQLAAIGTPVPGEARGMPGVGRGVAGAREGPRYQLGAPGNPLPEYPERVRRRGQEGRVVLAVNVTAAGEPLSVEVADGSGHDLLDRAALRAVRRWRFHPAAGVDPRDVSLVKVPITFRLKD